MKRVLSALVLTSCLLPGSAAAGLFDRTIEIDEADIVLQDMSIAQRYHFLQDYAELQDTGPLRFERECTIAFWNLAYDPQQDARLSNCRNHHPESGEMERYSYWDRVVTSYASQTLPRLPFDVWSAYELEAGDDVRFALTIDPAELAVPLDMEAGRLVGPEEVVYGSERLRLDFPPRARRMGVGGVLKLHCQIQQDYSLICIPQSFEFPEHFDLFADYFLRQSRRLTMGEMLKDGSPSAGAHFKLDVNYKLY